MYGIGCAFGNSTAYQAISHFFGSYGALIKDSFQFHQHDEYPDRQIHCAKHTSFFIHRKHFIIDIDVVCGIFTAQMSM